MNLFTYQQRYSEMNGEPSGKIPVVVGVACDFCGERFAIPGETPTVLYNVHGDGGCEEWFSGDTLLVSKGAKHLRPFESAQVEIDLYSLYNDHPDFIYCQEWCGVKDCAKLMIEDWMSGEGDGSLCDAMSRARYCMIKATILDGRFTLKELSLETQ